MLETLYKMYTAQIFLKEPQPEPEMVWKTPLVYVDMAENIREIYLRPPTKLTSTFSHRLRNRV